MTGGPEPDTQPPDVFVSYSRTDESDARKIIDFLQNEGFSVWWDGMLGAGEVFIRTTEQALEHAKVVLVVWSERSIDSNWVRDEAQAGRESERLVPVSIDGSQPPLGFRQFQSVDLSRWNGKADAPEICNVRDAVARGVGRQLEQGETVAPAYFAAPQSSTPKGRNRWLLALAAVVLATIALGWSFLPASGDETRSIAILPFDNLSEEADQDYFSSGLSEEMRQVLSQNPLIRVAAQTSTVEASAGGQAAEAIAAALKVTHLLDGSVRREGDTVRVTVQLIDGTTGFDIWSETYERSLDDIFGVQSDIANQIAGALELRVAEQAGEIVARRGGTEDPAAYDAYLRGRSLFDLAIDESTDRAALRQFEIAVESDPEYAVAWAAISRAQTVMTNSYPSDVPLAEAFGEAIASARKSIELSPDLAVGHAALGFALFNGRLDVASAEQPYREAFRLGQGDADILQSYATFAARIGDFDAAREAIAKAIELDPLNAVAKRSRALIEYAAGDLDTAQTAAEEVKELNPEMRVVNRILGDIAYLRGDFQTALERYREEPSNLSRLPGEAMTYAKLGDQSRSAAALEELRSEFGSNGLYQQAQVLAQTGRLDDALNALEEAFAENDSGLVLMRNDPMFTPLREQPRFNAQLQRMGFTVPE